MGLLSSIGSALGGAVGGPIGATIGGALGSGIEGRRSGSNARNARRLTKDAINYLKKQGKTVEEIREISNDASQYEDVFAGYSDEIYDFADEYGQFAGDYTGYEDYYTDVAGQQMGRADDMWARYQEVFVPLQDQAIAEVAGGPDTEGARAMASADVAQAFDTQRGATRRQQQRYGVDPSSGRAMALEDDMARQQAIAEVSARNKAARDEEDRHWSKLLTATQMGAPLPSQANSMTGQAVGFQQAGEGTVGRRMAVTDRQLGAIGSAMSADQAAYGAVQDRIGNLNTVANQEGNIATGFGGQAQTAHQAAGADSRGAGAMTAVIANAFGQNPPGNPGGKPPQAINYDEYGEDAVN